MDYLIHILIITIIYILLAISLNIELGYTGLYNFGHVAFFGIGAYTSALLSLKGMPILISFGIAILVAGTAGFLISFPSLRLSGDFFGIATLAFSEMTRLFFLNERWLTKGPMGLPGIPRPMWIGQGVNALPRFLLFVLLLSIGVFISLYYLTGSPFGRALKVVRDDEHVAQAMGKDVFSLKVKVIALGSALAGLAGVMWAHYITYISPADFTLDTTILIILCVVLGGKGTRWGPVLGAILVIFFREALRFLPIPSDMSRFIAPIQGMVFGAVLVILMLKRPSGILSEHT